MKFGHYKSILKFRIQMGFKKNFIIKIFGREITD